jgi:hypothetical protein
VHLISTLVAVVGIVVVGILVWLSALVDAHTQQRLVHTQVDQAGVVIGEIVPTIQTPLETSVAIADVTGGNAPDVRRYVASDVGAGRLFTSLSLWRVGPAGEAHLLTVGTRPVISGDRAKLGALFAALPGPRALAVVNLLSAARPRLGFAVESVGSSPRYVVYAEDAVPPDRHATVPATSAFRQLNFALYLGSEARAADLIEATVPAATLPLAGATRTVVPFGTAHVDLVAAPTEPLSGRVLPALPWIIGSVGGVLVLAGVVMAEWLMRRRRTAENLAHENHRLYAEQRSIARSLQSALLPKQLPAIQGLECSARYVPGDPAADVGGDWYDVIRCDTTRALFAVGDVSGRGLAAANTMASLHYAIRAYAAQGDDAPTILRKLADLLDVGRDGHFATVLLGSVDITGRRMTLVSAGHLPPLVVSGAGASYVPTPPGPPIGVAVPAAYEIVSIPVPVGASVLAYTDGLVERRGEVLDDGLERLRRVAGAHGSDGRAGSLLDAVVDALAADGASDDIALLELHWTG